MALFNLNAGFNFNITKKSVSFSSSGNIVGANITAPSTVSKMGAVITYTETGTNTLNTDIIMQLSSDGGSNFTTATLTALTAAGTTGGLLRLPLPAGASLLPLLCG